jgi:hypothetical protein
MTSTTAVPTSTSYRAVHRGSLQTLATGTPAQLAVALADANLDDVALYTSLEGPLEGLVHEPTIRIVRPRDAEQDRINGLDASQPQALAAEVRRVAEAAHAQHPQYRGHWEGWSLGRMKRDLEMAGGVIVEGDILLVKAWPAQGDIPAYSVRRGHDVSIPAGWGYIEPVS